MPFIEPKDLRVGAMYKLTEFVECKPVSSGDYLLVLMEKDDGFRDPRYPRLGFARVKDIPPQVYLSQAHPQFGDPTWRHALKTDKGWSLFWPIGATTWNHSWVEITPL